MTDPKTASRSRWKLLASMMTTYGYALLGGTVLQPLLKGGPVSWTVLAGAGLGVVFHALALYISPKGEPP